MQNGSGTVLRVTLGRAGGGSKGKNLPMPTLPLTQAQMVTVQLKNTAGVRWEADYSAPAKRNDTSQFKDTSD